MAFKDALNDSVTISTVTTGFAGGDSIGEEVKTLVALYTDVPCKLMNGQRSQRVVNDQGEFEGFKNLWLIQMESSYNGANRGDSAIVNGQTYIVTRKQEIRGATSAVHHMVYYLEEKV